MLKTYLFAIIIGLQAAVGLNLTVGQTGQLTGFESRPVALARESSRTSVSTNQNLDYLQEIKKLGITLHPGKDYAKDSNDNPETLKKCAGLVYKTLSTMPQDTVKKIKNLTLYSNSNGRRGLGGGSTIILRCQNVTDEELVSVLVHELGHIEDTGVLKGSFWAKSSEFMDGQADIYQNDLSLDFYRISFLDENTLKRQAKEQDFVSGYAMTDPFEDFAETYNFYLLHGESFRQMAEQNSALSKKYNFMKNSVFSGVEYSNDQQPNLVFSESRNYDVTVLGFDLNKFLAYS